MGLNPIVLQNEVTPGTMSIFAKLEKYSQVAYIVVLMTPDDLGAAVVRQNESTPRARQNVVFELGYFIGKYTQHHVAVLVPEDAGDIFNEFSDFYGMEYVPVDANSDDWKHTLYRKLKAVGLEPTPLV
jgi:predicted nucleotide-binding protein